MFREVVFFVTSSSYPGSFDIAATSPFSMVLHVSGISIELSGVSSEQASRKHKEQTSGDSLTSATRIMNVSNRPQTMGVWMPGWMVHNMAVSVPHQPISCSVAPKLTTNIKDSINNMSFTTKFHFALSVISTSYTWASDTLHQLCQYLRLNNIEDPDSRCNGTNRTNRPGQRCGNRLNKTKRPKINRLLRKMVRQPPQTWLDMALLRKLAALTLCTIYHSKAESLHCQIEEVAQRYWRLIEAMLSDEVSPLSSTPEDSTAERDARVRQWLEDLIEEGTWLPSTPLAGDGLAEDNSQIPGAYPLDDASLVDSSSLNRSTPVSPIWSPTISLSQELPLAHLPAHTSTTGISVLGSITSSSSAPQSTPTMVASTRTSLDLVSYPSHISQRNPTASLTQSPTFALPPAAYPDSLDNVTSRAVRKWSVVSAMITMSICCLWYLFSGRLW